MKKQFLTVKQLANKIGYHPDTVYKWLEKFGAPKIQKKHHGRIKIDFAGFLKWWTKEK